MFVDTHLHLDEPWLKDNTKRQQAIADITKNQIVTWAVSCDIPSYEKTLQYSNQSDYIFPAFGILPWYAHDYADRLDEVGRLCDEAIMLGEIGLDYKNAKDKACYPHQKPLLDVFLKAAEKHDFILNLHFRECEEEAVEFMSSYNVRKAILHVYTGPHELMKRINDLGYYYSVSQSVLRNPSVSRTKHMIKTAQLIPSDRLLLEIDVLPRSNILPSELFTQIVTKLAEHRNTTPKEIEALNHENVLRLVDNDPRLSKMTALLKQ